MGSPMEHLDLVLASEREMPFLSHGTRRAFQSYAEFWNRFPSDLELMQRIFTEGVSILNDDTKWEDSRTQECARESLRAIGDNLAAVGKAYIDRRSRIHEHLLRFRASTCEGDAQTRLRLWNGSFYGIGSSLIAETKKCRAGLLECLGVDPVFADLKEKLEGADGKKQ